MNSLFAIQECGDCDIKFENIPQMDVHMKVVHHESEHKRIQRRVEIVTFASNSHKPAKEHSVTESKRRRPEPHLVWFGLVLTMSHGFRLSRNCLMAPLLNL